MRAARPPYSGGLLPLKPSPAGVRLPRAGATGPWTSISPEIEKPFPRARNSGALWMEMGLQIEWHQRQP